MDEATKEYEIRSLVREAAWEARNRPVSIFTTNLVFEPIKEQTAHRKQLLGALKHTDALLVLDELLNGEPTE